MPVLSSDDISAIERALGYTFTDPSYLIEALTHRSFAHENAQPGNRDNERLEFLGDAVLGLAISDALHAEPAVLSDAEMSRMKSHLVNRSVLYEAASRLSIGPYIQLGKGEEQTGGRVKKTVLANAFEALLGAVYRDGGYEVARLLILRLLRDRISRTVAMEEGYDAKSVFQELCQELFGQVPEYRIIGQHGSEHQKTFTVDVFVRGTLCGTGIGKSKKEAETAAARNAIPVISQRVPSELQTRYALLRKTENS